MHSVLLAEFVLAPAALVRPPAREMRPKGDRTYPTMREPLQARRAGIVRFANLATRLPVQKLVEQWQGHGSISLEAGLL